MEQDLVSAFSDGLVASVDIDDHEGLRLQLGSMLQRARQAWPTITVTDEQYARHVATLVREGEDPLVALVAIRPDDVFVACGCALGAADAVRAFESDFIRPARVVIARETDVVDPEEFFQRLRERLLVAPEGKRSRIAGFSGKGKLANWVRIAAQRLLIDEYRRREAAATEVPHDPLDPVRAAGVDPEIGVLKDAYREGFQAAFEGAFAKLSVRQRSLMRYRYVEGLEVNQIAAISGRHRVSVYRAIVKARETLLEHLRRDMAERLAVGNSEADSVLRLMRSQLDVRISRLFQSD